jgi:plasmid stabilization system protein ParE
MSRLIVSLKARADTSDIIKDLANKAGHGGADAYAAFFARVNERLAEFPDSGARRPSLGRACAFVSFRRTSSFTNTWKPTTLLWFCASFTDVAKSDENL